MQSRKRKKTFNVSTVVGTTMVTKQNYDLKDGEVVAPTLKASWNKLLGDGKKIPAEKEFKSNVNVLK